MKMKILTTAMLLSFLLCGCGHVSNAVLSDDSLLDKAEMATGIPKNELLLEKREGGIDDVQFTVKTKDNEVFRCYITSMVAITSDAVCKQIGESKTKGKRKTVKPTGNCNELLRAAGRC